MRAGLGVLARGVSPESSGFAISSRYWVGVDLGQRQDHTALAVLGRWEEQTGFDYVHWRAVMRRRHVVGHLERMALGTPWLEVVARVKELVREPRLAGRCEVAADATGVGGPVVEALRRAGLKCGVTAVTITAGERARQENGWWYVPKRDLISGLQLMLERGELEVSGKLKEARVLVEEMSGMRVKVAESGREKYGAWREGEHDDVVLAVALACWRAKIGTVGERGQRVFP